VALCSQEPEAFSWRLTGRSIPEVRIPGIELPAAWDTSESWGL